MPAVDAVPSPQSIVAVKSAIDDEPAGGRGIGVGELGDRPAEERQPNTGTGKRAASVELTVGWVAVAVSGASAMTAEPEIDGCRTADRRSP